MSGGGASVAGHLILTPLLVLSQPPWDAWAMLALRALLIGLFLVALRTLVTLWWVNRHQPGSPAHYRLRDWVIPLCLAGVGLVLLCSAHRGPVDRLFTRADRALMNGSLSNPRVTARESEGWYRVVAGPGPAVPAPAPGEDSVPRAHPSAEIPYEIPDEHR